MLRIRCELCGEKVRRGRMAEHKRRVHRWSKKVDGGSFDYDDCHDEETLCRALRQSLKVRVGIERTDDWGLSKVPVLRADGAWRDDHLDAYWRAFTNFCRWPEWKENARLEVYGTDPTLARSDAKRIVLFYRGDKRRLSVLIHCDNEALSRTKVIDRVSLQEVYELRNFGDTMLP